MWVCRLGNAQSNFGGPTMLKSLPELHANIFSYMGGGSLAGISFQMAALQANYSVNLGVLVDLVHIPAGSTSLTSHRGYGSMYFPSPSPDTRLERSGYLKVGLPTQQYKHRFCD